MIPASKILIADDNPSIREYLNGLLMNDAYELVFAEDGAQAFERVQSAQPDLILLDVMMPKMNGVEVCRLIRQDPRLAEMPIIMITALDDRNSRLQGLQAGADDFISKPFDAQELMARINTITRLNRYRRLNEERAKFEQLVKFSPDGIVILNAQGEILMANPAFMHMTGTILENQVNSQRIEAFLDPTDGVQIHLKLAEMFSGRLETLRLESTLRQSEGKRIPIETHASLTQWEDGQAAQLIMHDITNRKQSEEKLHQAHEELKTAYNATIEGWALTLELRDIETSGHSRRVTDYAMKLAQLMGFKDEALNDFYRGATLHDIGKIGIPDSILLKPDRLTETEMNLMRQHTQYAFKVLSNVGFTGPVVDIPHYHHEKWDGSGYPQGLKGEEIPLSARIFAIVDVWDALSSDRPYRPAWSNDKVLGYLYDESGKHFDPEVVQTFLELLQKES
jgi:PAS domain S-box-containing protein